jgi:hypothetical protein
MYPDNEGLQVVPHSTLEHDANGLGCPKVPGHDAPELAPDRSNAPECYNAAVSEHINATAPEHINTDDNETTPPASELKADHQQQVQSKRFCGLSKRRVIIIGAVIAAIVIAVAVALGVVLGRKSSAPSDPSPSPSSSVAAFLPSFNGLALTKVKTSNGNSTIGYYQDVYGNIRERRALNTTWQYADNDIVVANAAVNGSTPVAATTYSTGDTLYVCFLLHFSFARVLILCPETRLLHQWRESAHGDEQNHRGLDHALHNSQRRHCVRVRFRRPRGRHLHVQIHSTRARLLRFSSRKHQRNSHGR